MSLRSKIRSVVPTTLPAPAGHYHPGVVYGDFVFISGQLPTLAKELFGDEGFRSQARAALTQVFEVLREADSSPEDLVKVSVYLVGVKHWTELDAIYCEMLGTAKPARSVIPVPELHHGFLVEIDAVAARRQL